MNATAKKDPLFSDLEDPTPLATSKVLPPASEPPVVVQPGVVDNAMNREGHRIRKPLR